MGVYWNPANTCYYRSLERAARNVYLATQGTSGPQSVRTPTGINYIEGSTAGRGSGATKKQSCEAPDPTLAAALKEAGTGGNITLRKLKEVLLGAEGGDAKALEARAKSLTGAERSAIREAIDAGLFKHKSALAAAEQLASGSGFSVVGIRSAQ